MFYCDCSTRYSGLKWEGYTVIHVWKVWKDTCLYNEGKHTTWCNDSKLYSRCLKHGEYVRTDFWCTKNIMQNIADFFYFYKKHPHDRP